MGMAEHVNKLRPDLVVQFPSQLIESVQINIYSMKHPDLYYFETIKITSQA